MNHPGSDSKALAREFFLRALQEASIANGFAKHIQCDRGVLRVCEDLFNLSSYSRVYAVSIGKAGHSMAKALVNTVGEGWIQGIVSCPVQPEFQVKGFR